MLNTFILKSSSATLLQDVQFLLSLLSNAMDNPLHSPAASFAKKDSESFPGIW